MSRLAGKVAVVFGGALMPAASPPPQARGAGPTEMYGMYQQLQGTATTTAYANAFLITAAITLFGSVLAFFMGKPERSGPAATPTEDTPTEDTQVGHHAGERAPEPVPALHF